MANNTILEITAAADAYLSGHVTSTPHNAETLEAVDGKHRVPMEIFRGSSRGVKSMLQKKLCKTV